MSTPAPLPASIHEFMTWDWEQIALYYEELTTRELDASSVDAWLADWSSLASLLDERRWRLRLATMRNTTDEGAQRQYQNFLATIAPAASRAEQALKQKLIASHREPQGLAIPLRNMRADVELFREANVPLLAREEELVAEHNQLGGAQTVQWEGAEIPIIQLMPVFQDPDRARREHAFVVRYERLLQVKTAYDELWQRLLQTRLDIAANAGFLQRDGTPDYRAYRWRALKRFDYSPDDCKRFHESIEQVAAPMLGRLFERGRRALGVEALKPWDVLLGTVVEPPNRERLVPFHDVPELIAKTAAIYQAMDPQWSAYFELMWREDLMDLEVRAQKAVGGFCISFQVARRPFLFFSAVPVQGFEDVLFHESAHGFHILEMSALPYLPQHDLWNMPVEFIEVPTMAMELLAMEYWAHEEGSFYSHADVARARRLKLESQVFQFCDMIVIDAFQHWIYEHPREALDPARCDEQFVELMMRFFPSEIWRGFEPALAMTWRRLPHIFQLPFYYIEYAIAQLGAIQLWAQAQDNQAAVFASLCRAMALGNTVPLPELYHAAGIPFAFDRDTVRHAVNLIEKNLEELK